MDWNEAVIAAEPDQSNALEIKDQLCQFNPSEEYQIPPVSKITDNFV